MALPTRKVLLATRAVLKITLLGATAAALSQDVTAAGTARHGVEGRTSSGGVGAGVGGRALRTSSSFAAQTGTPSAGRGGGPTAGSGGAGPSGRDRGSVDSAGSGGSATAVPPLLSAASSSSSTSVTGKRRTWSVESKTPRASGGLSAKGAWWIGLLRARLSETHDRVHRVERVLALRCCIPARLPPAGSTRFLFPPADAPLALTEAELALAGVPRTSAGDARHTAAALVPSAPPSPTLAAGRSMFKPASLSNMLIGVAEDEGDRVTAEAEAHHHHHGATAAGGSGHSSLRIGVAGIHATPNPQPSPPPHDWKRDPVCQRRSRALYRALLTEGMDRWPQFIVDLVVLTLAAAPNLAKYTGKVRLYAELDAYERWNLYSGPDQPARRHSTTPRGDGTAPSSPAAASVPPAARGPPVVAVVAGVSSSTTSADVSQSAAESATAIPDSVRLASRVRHRDIIAHACTDTLLLLVKALRVG